MKSPQYGGLGHETRDEQGHCSWSIEFVTGKQMIEWVTFKCVSIYNDPYAHVYN